MLSDQSIREGVKTYSNWPTIPQLYIDGEFLGGCDIMIEMYQNGELQEEIEKAAASCVCATPRIRAYTVVCRWSGLAVPVSIKLAIL